MILAASIVGLLAIAAGLAKGRDKKWGMVIWLPAIVVPVYFAVSLLGVLPGKIAGPGPDTGAVGMASMFYLFGTLPLLALLGGIFLLAVFLRPRAAARNMFGAFGGLCVCLVFAIGWNLQRNEQVEVIVLDEAGHPVSGPKVTFSYMAFGIGKSLGSAITDKNGRAHVRAPRADNWSAETISADGTRCVTGCSKQAPSLPGQPDLWIATAFWQHPSWTIWFASSVTSYVSREATRPLTLHLRSGKTLFSPWVIETIRGEIAAQTTGSRPAALARSENLKTLETYVLMPELIEAGRWKFLPASEGEELLSSLARRLASAYDICQRPAKREASEGAFLFHLLREWTDPDHKVQSDEAATRVIEARVVALANELVNKAEPYWETCGPMGLPELGELAAPFAARLLSALEKVSDERDLSSYIDWVGRQKIAVDQVRPFFNHPKRAVAVATILSAQAGLSSVEKTQLLTPYSHPGENTWLQHQIEDALRPNKR
jgi:hypothetical protein